MDSFYLIGFAQALFFALVILTKRGKKLSDFTLAFFLFLLASQLFFLYAYINRLTDKYVFLYQADIYYWTLLGPTLCLYTEFLSSPVQKFKKKHLLYLLPTIIVTIGFRKYVFIEPSLLFRDSSPETWFFTFSKYVWFYNSPLFVIYSIIQLKNHSKRVKDYFSYSKNIDLKWLYFMNIGFASFLLIMILNPYIRQLFNTGLPSSFTYAWFVMTLYVFGIGFYGFRQKGIFNEQNDSSFPIIKREDEEKSFPKLTELFNITVSEEKISYEKSGLSKEEADHILAGLEKEVRENKLYLDFDLDLSRLAKRLNTSTHKLSQVINEKTGKNFFEYINGYRVEEIKSKLSDPALNQYKIIALAYECGFNSKSTFYNFFKKYTSQTPADYRQTSQKMAV